MSVTESSTREALLAELAALIEPLALLSSPEDVAQLVRALGWDFPAITEVPAAFDLIVTGVTDARTALEQLDSATTDDQTRAAAGALLSAITKVLGGTAGLADAIDDGWDQIADFARESGLATELPRRLLDFVLLEYLLRRQRVIARALLLLGLIDFIVQDGDDPASSNPPRHRIDAIIPTVHWERVPLLFSNPKQILEWEYGWLTDFRAGKFLARAMSLFNAMGLPLGEFEQGTELAEALGRPLDPRTEYRVAVLQAGDPFGATAAELGFRLCDLPATSGNRAGIAALPYAMGGPQLEIEPSPGWKLTITTALDLTANLALVLRPPDLFRFETDLLGSTLVAAGKLAVELRRLTQQPNTEIIIVGEPGKTRLAFREFCVGITGILPPELIFSTDVVGLAVAVVPGDGDGFLRKILPAEGIRAGGDLGIEVSTKTGFRFKNGAGFEVDLPLRLSLGGVIELKALWVRLSASDDGLRLALAVTAGLKIGPLAATVERIGIQMMVKPAAAGVAGSFGQLDMEQGFRPPSGAGMSISAGPVTGGGYLFFDPDNEQYAGILQLSFQQIGLTAIGLLTTRLPDPAAPGGFKKGFSLLIIITVDLPPIQLGYGFTLNGVGGLLGIHRTMMVDVLRDGVRNRTVEAILFPQNPIARASEIISTLRAVFPPAEGRFVFGPMVKLGWGPNAIISLELAVVLELAAPIRLVILGRVQIALPDKKDGILNLRLDIVGVIDFDKGEVSVDASLVDSRLAVFVITGDMAVRISWGASKIFAIGAGGFHPRFQAPPGFPQLRRLAIALADSDNPRIRMEKYFALTANSLQMGAGLDIFVKVDTPLGSFSFAALANFDALVQFQPFSLIAELGASIVIALNNKPVLQAALFASLSGPSPWRIAGYAEFNFLGNHRIDVEATIGEPLPAPPIVKLPSELLQEITTAFGRSDAWAALPPMDAERVVTLRDQPAADRIRVHPLGALSARQRVLPLKKVIERFGAAEVEPTTFMLNGFTVGASQGVDRPAEDLYDDFAPGQFTPLTDDEKTARPAFESMQSGGRVDVKAFRVGPAALASFGYEESIVDDEPATFTRVATVMTGVVAAALPAAAIASLAGGGAAAHAPTRTGGSIPFRAPALAIGVKGERYVASSANTLVAEAASGAGTSAAEAYDALHAHGGESQGAPGQVALAHEAA